MFERLKKTLARITGKPPEPATPVTYGAGGDAQKNQFARIGKDENTDRRTKIKRFMKAYQRGGLYADMLDSYHLFALAPGYKLMCEKGAEPMKDQVQAWLDQPHVDLDSIMGQAILSAKLAGDSYQEILPTKDKKGVWGVLTRDPSTFDKVPDKYGRIDGYRQMIPGESAGQEKAVEIEKGRILNLMLDSVPGNIYGQSIWDRAEDNILQDCDIIESIVKAMHRHGTTKGVWNLGSEDNRASDSDIKGFRKEVEEMDAKTDFVVTHDTKYTNIDTGGIPNVDVYSNTSLQRCACSLGVPEEMAGLGRGSTEATATVRMETFLKRVSAIQKVTARTFSRQLIDRITGQPGMVWIEFEEANPEDFAKLATAIAALRKEVDPDAIAYAEWARERLKIPPPPDESTKPPEKTPATAQE